MTATSARHRLLNLVQSALLLGLMAAVAWVSVTVILGPGTGLLVALGMVAGLFLAPDLSRRMLLSAYRAQRLTGREAPGLIAALAELARRAGLPRTPALYRVPSRLPNAFAMGSPEDSTICVTDGLLEILDGRELASVLAHEIGHIAHRDLWIMGLADVMSRLVSLALVDPGPLLHESEVLLRDGVPVGDVRAASYGWTVGAAIGIASVSAGEPVTAEWLAAGSWEVDIAGVRHPARVSLDALL